MSFDATLETEFKNLIRFQMRPQMVAVVSVIFVTYSLAVLNSFRMHEEAAMAAVLGLLALPFGLFATSRRLSSFRSVWIALMMANMMAGLSLIHPSGEWPVPAVIILITAMVGGAFTLQASLWIGLTGGSLFMLLQPSWDYLLLWFDWASLLLVGTTVGFFNERRIRRDFQARKEVYNSRRVLEINNARLVQLSNRDALTHVPNRRRFDKVLAEEWRRARREQYPIAFMMIDVDDFKSYNDTYGHLAGDRCLKHVALCLRAFARRQGDLLARYGGEEFAMILPRTSEHEAKLIADQIIKAVYDVGIEHVSSGVADVVTVSIGVAALQPQDGESSDVLSGRADQALYLAKRVGRNTVRTAADVEKHSRLELAKQTPQPVSVPEDEATELAD